VVFGFYTYQRDRERERDRMLSNFGGHGGRGGRRNNRARFINAHKKDEMWNVFRHDTTVTKPAPSSVRVGII
jgi:hypothetical protein